MNQMINHDAGFRLQRLEVYNWGTFDNQVWSMDLASSDSVLTGLNGTGKTTLVDALLTLLVPYQHGRAYNMASGSDSRRERSLKTYVQGAFSRGDDGLTRYLRDRDNYSVLLAIFSNQFTGQVVTLAQVFRVQSDRIDQKYYVSDQALSISSHFKHPGGPTKQEREDFQIALFPSFRKYQVELQKIGIRSEQAMTVFAKTVSLKDIASLNEFIRTYMLDPSPVQEEMERLAVQNNDLTQAYEAIQRARKQIEVLEPLCRAGERVHDYRQRIDQHERAKALIPFYVASKKRQLLEDKIRQSETELHRLQDSRLRCEDSLKNLREEKRQTQNALEQDESGKRIQQLTDELDRQEGQLTTANNRAKEYEQWAVALGISLVRNEADFWANREQLQNMESGLNEEIELVQDDQALNRSELQQLQEEERNVREELEYLEANPSQIPLAQARIRASIANELGLMVEDLPFVGELLRIPDTEREWEGALERLLHSFALEMLVSDAYYPAVSDYVNRENLGARLVYRRLNEQQVNDPPYVQPNPHHISARVDIRQESRYAGWLQSTLMERFDYVCCDDLTTFRREKKAITREGQIKHSATRHEKDDRRPLTDRRHYVLGWDNRGKIQTLQIQFENIKAKIATLQQQYNAYRARFDKAHQAMILLDRMLQVQSYETIDWQRHQRRIDELTHEREELESQADHLQVLQRKLDEINEQIRQEEGRHTELIQQHSQLEIRVQSFQTELEAASLRLQQFTDAHRGDWEDVGTLVEDRAREIPNDLDALRNADRTLGSTFDYAINSFRGIQNEAEKEVVRQMQTFRERFPHESTDVDTEMEALPAYEAIYARLIQDDLPQYEERFRLYLNDTLANSITLFRGRLFQQVDHIKKRIGDLNQALESIPYTDCSIIQIQVTDSRNPEVRQFKADLEYCIPNQRLSGEEQELRRAYEQIQTLITRFREEPAWVSRVADTRQWLEFAAQELDTTTGEPLEHYTDSSGKSGGQKAKLAYTILAAALVYQYGVQDDRGIIGNSFRFVVIDEAFSKLDDDNARYAMELFERLGLQVMVVTPMDKIHVLEPYVDSYHLTAIREGENQSEVYTISREEYVDQRQKLNLQNRVET